MKNTKLIKLLKTFSDADVKKFRDFVKSPFYNKNKSVIKLNEVLLKYYPGFDSKTLTEEKVFAKIFGDEKYDYFKLKNVSSDLYNLGLEYLKQFSNHNTSFSAEYNMLVQLRGRRLHGLHKKMVKALEKEFNEKKFKDSAFLYNNYLLITESQLSDLFEKPSSVSGILDEFDSIYEYIILNLLRYYNLMIHIGKGNKINQDIKMLEEVISYLQKGPASDNPVITTYQYLLLLKLKNKEEYYFILKDLYSKHFSFMDAEDAYRTHMYIFGYCMDKYNFDADRRFVTECYELYKHSYKNNMVTLGELLYPDFVNYVKVFVRAGDIRITRKFISDYGGKLPDDQKNNCLNFSDAYICHYEGEFKKALEYLSKVNFPLAILKVQVRIMQVQLHYQAGHYEQTREVIESFTKVLRRETVISDDYKNSIYSFLKNTLALLNIQQELVAKERDFAITKLEIEIAENQRNHFGVKFWLADRINELKIKQR